MIFEWDNEKKIDLSTCTAEELDQFCFNCCWGTEEEFRCHRNDMSYEDYVLSYLSDEQQEALENNPKSYWIILW